MGVSGSVLKYTSVTIAAGATVTFSNHPSRAPVVWLVKEDVRINGALSVDGTPGPLPPDIAEPGPGGFRGGLGDFVPGVAVGPGFGLGGGQNIPDRSGGSYGSLGLNGTSTYGNPSLLPLIGGSGGSGDSDGGPNSSRGGGAGGGAILIACSGEMLVSDGASIRANGGEGGFGESARHSAGGSGGGIRLVCTKLSGTGVIQALGGGAYRPGGLGRIRIEKVTDNGALRVTPDPSVVTLQAQAAPLIWLPNDAPTARIVSIGAVAAPADPRASFGALSPDVALPQVTTTPVVVETTNAENASIVKVRVSPRANGAFTETTATLTRTNNNNPLVLLWTASVPVNPGYSAIQVKVVRP